MKIHTVRSRLTILLPCTVPINCIANCTNVYDRIHLYNSNSVHAFDTRDPCVPRCVRVALVTYYYERRQQRMPKERKIESRNRDIVPRTEYRYREKNKEKETIIYITIELYTYQGTIVDNLPFSIRYFHVSSSIEKLFSR